MSTPYLVLFCVVLGDFELQMFCQTRERLFANFGPFRAILSNFVHKIRLFLFSVCSFLESRLHRWKDSYHPNSNRAASASPPLCQRSQRGRVYRRLRQRSRRHLVVTLIANA